MRILPQKLLSWKIASLLVVFLSHGWVITESLPAQELGKKYAVIIGVEKYDPDELNQLSYAVDDAEALAAELTRLQFDVTVMTENAKLPQLKPNTAEKIIDVLKNRAAGLTAEDTLLLAFMGHGVQFAADKKQPAPDNDQDSDIQELYFCPEEARLQERDTLLSLSLVHKVLEASAAGRKLLIVDACRNDPQPQAKRRGKEVELEPVGRAVRTVPRGMLALFSCSQAESSREYPELQHGVFTAHVLKYLRGEADAAFYPENQLTLSELTHYVARETKDYVWKKDGKDQIPIAYGTITPWVLGKSAPRPANLDAPYNPTKVQQAQAAWARYLGRQRTEKTTQGLELVLIPPGKGVSQPYYLGKTEVTQAQYKKVTGKNPSYWATSGEGAARLAKLGLDDPAELLPVENVTWEEADAFCKKLTELEQAEGKIPAGYAYRLPLAVEWDHAAMISLERGGVELTERQLEPIAWFADNADYHAQPVARLRGSSLGIYDMLGNVTEWCLDEAPNQPNQRIHRGGAFTDSAEFCDAGRVASAPVDKRYNIHGLRVCLGPVPARGNMENQVAE
ncbi:MAG: SUMF1/EgtB/PvdO family nonheme iron enzyme [Pirellulales bacterium]|nr:SUMF1/EgtB/PvdO family nonheme iron enzyme [Pirellulales bacterium]